MIAQILVATLIVSVLATINLIFAINDLRHVDGNPREVVRSMRRVVISICWVSVPAAFALRSVLALIGVENTTAATVVFWSWLGVNIVGGLYAVISEKYD